MKRIRFRPLVLAGVLLLNVFSSSGCIVLFASGLGAVGGYAVSPDTVEGVVDRTYIETWDAAVEVARIMGAVESQDEELGEISALIHGARVHINIYQFSADTVQVRVKARKTFFPRISIAQEVFIKIMKYLDVSV